MKSNLISKENNVAKFTVEVPYEDFKKYTEIAYKKHRGEFNIHGFRKGKAPRKILEMNYGKDLFFENAINELLPEALDKALVELELEIVSKPVVDLDEIKENEALIIKFEADLKPIPVINDYSNLVADITKYEVTEEAINDKVRSEIEKNVRLVEVKDKSSKLGDIVNIDFEGFLNDVAFEGGKAEKQDLTLGSGTFIPGFEEQLVDKNTGDSLDVVVTFPSEYGAEELQGKEAVFKVKINSIKEKQEPIFDDEFVKDVSEFDTIDEYKNSIKEEIEKELVEKVKKEKEEKAIDALIAVTEVSIPKSMIEQRAHDDVEEFKNRIASSGFPVEQYFEYTNTNEENLYNTMLESAEKKIITDLMIEKYVELESISASDDDLNEELLDLAKMYRKEEEFDAFKEELENNGHVPYIKNIISKRLALEDLINRVKFNEVSPE